MAIAEKIKSSDNRCDKAEALAPQRCPQRTRCAKETTEMLLY